MIFYYRRLLTALHLIKLMKLKTFISAKLISNLKLHAAIEDTKKEKKKKRERECRSVVLAERDIHFGYAQKIN